MPRWISASVAGFGLLLGVLFISSAAAQINGAPASVTSPGFGGRAINGIPSSVTSLGPRGIVPSGSGFVPFVSSSGRARDSMHHHHRGDRFPDSGYPYYGYGAVYGVPVPYPDQAYADSDYDDQDSNYQGGPTIFDRRGNGAESYIPPVKDVPPIHTSTDTSAPQSVPEPVTPTVLVFKDGHQTEVDNYAIVGQTLYDLTPGHMRKVPIASLDLAETQKLNEEHGVSFQLPPNS